MLWILIRRHASRRDAMCSRSDYKLNLGGSWKSLISKNDTFQD